MASACLVSGLDATATCSEIVALFESAGTVTQTVVLSPGLGGVPAAVLVYFASSSAAAEAVDLFDSHPHAGCFLEVKVANGAASGRVLAALAEVQALTSGQVAAAPVLRAASSSLVAPAAPAPLVSFPGGGAGVPMPAPYAAVDSAAQAPAAAPAPTPAPHSAEPPAFGGAGFNPDDWLPPSDWQPSAAATAIAAGTSSAPEPWSAPAAPARQPSGGAGAASGPGAAAAAAQPGVPEWEVDSRCRIYISNMRPGLTADDMKAHFSKFGPLVDASVVPKQHIGFLTFRHAAHGEACLHATHGTTVLGLSPVGGSEGLVCEFRDLDKIKRHLTKTTRRPDVMDKPTTRVFIGYFPRSTKERNVREELERYGPLTEVMLGGGQDGGELYCFVQYKYLRDAASAHKAINGHTLPTLCGGRQMIAAFKEPRR